MTSTTYSYIGIAIAIACFLIPTWQAIFNKKGKGLNRITRLGYAMFVVAILFGLISFLSIGATNRDRNSDKKEVVDEVTNNVDNALKKYGLRYDSKTNTIKDTQTVFVALKPSTPKKINESPELIINYHNQPNPIFKKINNDTVFSIEVLCIKAIASVISYRFLCFEATPDYLYKKPPIVINGHYVGSMKTMPPNSIAGPMFFVNR